MTKRSLLDEIRARCPKCMKVGIYLVGEDHNILEWFKSNKALLRGKVLCSECMQTTDSDTMVEIAYSTRIYHNNTAYTIKEVAENFVVVIRSKTNLALHRKENFSADKPALILSPADQEKILRAMGKTIQESEANEEGNETLVGRIVIDGIASPEGLFIGSNNQSSIVKNGIKFTIAVFGSNMIIKDSQ